RARAQRPPRRCALAVRTIVEPDERPRPARGGVRREAQATGRELPAGVQPPHAHRRCGRDREGGEAGRPGDSVTASAQPAVATASRAARRLIAPLALAQFICSFAGSNMNVMINDISKDLNTSVKGVQTTITLFLLIMAVLMIPCSKLTDRWGRKRCLL